MSLGTEKNERLGDLLIFHFTRARETAEVLIGFAYTSEYLEKKDGHVYDVWVCELTDLETFGIQTVQTLIAKFRARELVYNPETDKRVVFAPKAESSGGTNLTWLWFVLGAVVIAVILYFIWKNQNDKIKEEKEKK